MSRLEQQVKKGLEPFRQVSTKEKRVIFVGAKRSGKTTALGCMSLACDLLSLEDPSFSHYIEEKSSGICKVPSDLCRGLFPEETPSGLIYEAIIHIRDRRALKERNVAVPCAETAGEDMESLTGPYTDSVYRQNPTWQTADILNRYICDSNAYLVSLPVSEANVPWVPEEFRDIQDEPVNDEGMFVDPDLTLKRILSAIFSYKDRNKGSTPRIEAIGILLTKADKILHFIKGHGMDLGTPQGQQRFLSLYFRQTAGVLKYFGLDKVRFFPVFVEVEKTRTPENKVVIHKVNGKPRIAMDQENNLPYFSKEVYKEVIRWILKTCG